METKKVELQKKFYSESRSAVKSRKHGNLKNSYPKDPFSLKTLKDVTQSLFFQ